MDRVKSKQDAMIWFLQNSLGNVECERGDGKITVCSTYDEACKFYETTPQEDR